MKLPCAVVFMIVLFGYSALLGLTAASNAHCDAGDCSKEELKSMVIRLQNEVHETKRQVMHDVANCTECFSEPCQNNGTCVPLPNYHYRCDCPSNTAGDNCETLLQCGPHSCGPNATCFVGQHRVNCVCNPGFSGSDPTHTGCNLQVVRSCFTGDPHYVTFDGLHYDYQGTCKYVVSEPCSGSLPGIPPFSVLANNVPVGTAVSGVNYAQLISDGTNIEVNAAQTLFVDGIITSTPYFKGGQNNWSIRVYRSGGKTIIETDYHLTIEFSVYSFCLTVPSAAPFSGAQTLCGLAGNIDGKCRNDMLLRNMTVLPADSCSMYPASSYRITEVYGDDWVVRPLTPSNCIFGTVMTNGSLGCSAQDFANAGVTCKPISDALSGIGVFGACQGMGADAISRALFDCQSDVCANGEQKCTAFTLFAHECQQMLPGTSLDTWRAILNCPLVCHSPDQIYSGCVSGCPATCLDHSDHRNCSHPCIEGCACSPGYVLQDTHCIPIDTCGCFDGQSMHPANSEWNTHNCSAHNECHNGTISSQPYACDPHATCSIVSQQEACQCDVGFTGNGTSCVDINECLDNSTCSQDLGQGTCTNTIGSYYCTCAPNFEGANCQFYLPRRHCADLHHFHNDTTTGIKTIYPSFAFASHPAYSPLTVFCNMDADQGGWTAFIGNGNSSVDKSYDEYVNGFGNVTANDFWLGLDFLFGATHEFDTSLRIELHDCNDQQNVNVDYTYPLFSLSSATDGYAPYIPQAGSGSAGNGWTNPWRPRGKGPKFSAGQHCTSISDNHGGQVDCCSVHGNIGWWYAGGAAMCNQANLNGIRYSCDFLDNAEGDDPRLLSAIKWGAAEMYSAAGMLIRPAGFPNYDHQRPITFSIIAWEYSELR